MERMYTCIYQPIPQPQQLTTGPLPRRGPRHAGGAAQERQLRQDPLLPRARPLHRPGRSIGRHASRVVMWIDGCMYIYVCAESMLLTLVIVIHIIYVGPDNLQHLPAAARLIRIEEWMWYVMWREGRAFVLGWVVIRGGAVNKPVRRPSSLTGWSRSETRPLSAMTQAPRGSKIKGNTYIDSKRRSPFVSIDSFVFCFFRLDPPRSRSRSH